MREAAVPGYRLSRSRASTRVLISLALVAVMLGLLTSVGVTLTKTGIAPTAVQSYFLGTPPTSELGGLLAESTARPFAELAEVTHLHLMGGSLMLFLLCHLLALCSVSDRTRVTLYVTSFISFLLTFGLPWLIVYLHPGFSYLYGPVVIILLLSLLILSAIPLREMWYPSRTELNDAP